MSSVKAELPSGAAPQAQPGIGTAEQVGSDTAAAEQAQPDTTSAGQARPAAATPDADSRARHGPFPGRYPVFAIIIDHDHHGNGRGEDAPPLFLPGLVGAFDGLGGAGGELVKLRDGTEQTGAWYASRLVRDRVLAVFERSAKQGGGPPVNRDLDLYGDAFPVPELYQEFDFTAEIRQAIQDKLDSDARRIRAMGGGSRIRSKLIKILPTTLAVGTYDLDEGQFTAIWAGDSRVFCLRPDAGLRQVTTDDLRTHADALKNLTEDSPMSNCVSAESDFVLHERQLPLEPFSILFAATDGCFGYVQTPLHFEHLLLSTMHEATGWADWQSRLQDGIVQVTSDDSTLAAAIIGWKDFASCRDAFRNRAAWCAAQVRAYGDAHSRVRRLEQDLDQARRELTETKNTLWEGYRKTYEMPTDTPTRDVPKRQQAERSEQGPADADLRTEADRP